MKTVFWGKRPPCALLALVAAGMAVLLCGCSQPGIPAEPGPAESVPAGSSLQLKQINCYDSQGQTRSETFQFNELGQLTAILLRDSSLGDTEVHLTFTYDQEGRLLRADRDDCWLYFSNEEYVYNDRGQLLEYIRYWGAEDLPTEKYTYTYDPQGNLETQTELLPGDSEMETAGIYTFEYLCDDDNRILECRKIPKYSISDFNYTTRFGTFPFCEYVSVSQYTYDEAGRILTLTQEDIPAALLTAEPTPGEQMTSGTHREYRYGFPGFLACEDARGNTTLSIQDPMGNEIWSVMLGNCEIVTDAQGYIRLAQDDAAFTWEFLYQ